jgi:hypothetical protein
MIFGCFVGRFVSVREGSMFIERKVRVFPLTDLIQKDVTHQYKKVRNRGEGKYGSEVRIDEV